jgi:hypothetical protein
LNEKNKLILEENKNSLKDATDDELEEIRKKKINKSFAEEFDEDEGELKEE